MWTVKCSLSDGFVMGCVTQSEQMSAVCDLWEHGTFILLRNGKIYCQKLPIKSAVARLEWLEFPWEVDYGTPTLPNALLKNGSNCYVWSIGDNAGWCVWFGCTKIEALARASLMQPQLCHSTYWLSCKLIVAHWVGAGWLAHPGINRGGSLLTQGTHEAYIALWAVENHE